MNKPQLKHLEERINLVARAHRYNATLPKKSASVLAAERAVAAYNATCERVRKAHGKRLDTALRTSREALYFNDTAKALAAVKRLEAEFPPKGGE